MITLNQVNAITATLVTAGVEESTVSDLRQLYQAIHFTYCMDDDLPNNTPDMEHQHFNLYLIYGREHCLCFTNDFDVATGIVVAELIPD
jgi:hypothetical protein